jgi:hypothetical protein
LTGTQLTAGLPAGPCHLSMWPFNVQPGPLLGHGKSGQTRQAQQFGVMLFVQLGLYESNDLIMLGR